MAEKIGRTAFGSLDGWLEKKPIPRASENFVDKEETSSDKVKISNAPSQGNLESPQLAKSTTEKSEGLKKSSHVKKRRREDVKSESSDEGPVQPKKKAGRVVRSQRLDDENSTPERRMRPASKNASPLLAEGKAVNALEGKKVVVTGVFDSMSREEMEEFVKRRGGQVMSAVSGRTDFLIFGSRLEDDRPVEEGSKYKKAVQINTGNKVAGTRTKPGTVTLLSEKEACALFGDSSPVGSSPTSSSNTKIAKASSKVKSETPMTREFPDAAISMLWSEKWRPQTIDEILGNGEAVKKLKAWLSDWHDVCILGQKKTPPRSRSRTGDVELINARAAMLSGPPGVGKTTAAKLVARACGYEIVEYNASDDRGKSIIEVISDMTSGGQTLTSLSNFKPKRAVLVMDEMDGLSVGDRGGAQALIKLIEKSLCPVICICNDRTNPKVKTLATKCYDLRFHKPPKNIIAKRIVDIGERQGIKIEYNAVEVLCESVGNDLRQILNMLQLICRNENTQVTYDSMKKEIGFGLKDTQVMTNPFETAKKLLTRSETSKLRFNDKLDLYFVDYDLMPLFMQENYINALLSSTKAPGKENEAFELLASISDCFTMADMMNTQVRKYGNWQLLGDIGLYGTVVPATQCSSFVARVDFPKWLGKNSTTNKNRRLLSELQFYLSPCTVTSSLAMRTSGYLELLYARILEPLFQSEDPKCQIQKSIDYMDAYGLTKDQVIENIGSLRLKRQEKTYELVDASIKRSLTTMYNSTTHAIKMAPPVILLKRGGGGGVRGPAMETEEGSNEGIGSAPLKENAPELLSQQADGEDFIEDDSAYLDRLILAKKKKGKATSKKKTNASPKSKAAAKRAPAKSTARKKV